MTKNIGIKVNEPKKNVQTKIVHFMEGYQSEENSLTVK